MKTLATKKAQQGFTLIELMIVVAIIGILASIAVPAYQTYTMKAKFAEVTMATSPFKVAVELCFLVNSTLANCSNGSNGVPNVTAATTGYVLLGSGAVTGLDATHATITATDSSAGGLTGKTIIFSGVAASANSPIIWTKSGTCLAAAIC